MNLAEHWLQSYGVDHTHPGNRLLHWICVPLMVVSVVGLLWSLPVPEHFARAPSVLNWGTLFLMATIVYYFLMSLRLALGMLPFLLGVILIVNWLAALTPRLWALCTVLLLVASVGLFVGHQLEGRRGSVLRDLYYLMLGPIWLLATVYRRLRVPY
jgi:uncharacterized membrane protein YGL010W